jgi:hypothetical protein
MDAGGTGIWRLFEWKPCPYFCLILMGVWRDSSQPRFEETGVIGTAKRKKIRIGGANTAERKIYSLDTGWLMGVPYFYEIRHGRHPLLF